jgi:DNA end-binding protein Ku
VYHFVQRNEQRDACFSSSSHGGYLENTFHRRTARDFDGVVCPDPGENAVAVGGSGRSRWRLEVRHYYLVRDGKIGHDDYAVVRETIRSMGKTAIGRRVLTGREHIIALEPMKKGLMGLLLRYPYEICNEDEYFDDIQDVKVTKEMLDLAKHIVEQKSGEFDPHKFDDRYETALTVLINAKRAGKTVRAKARPSGDNVVDLMDALKRSIAGNRTQPAQQAKAKPKRGRKTASGQKEMLLPIVGTPAKTSAKPVASRKRKTA